MNKLISLLMILSPLWANGSDRSVSDAAVISLTSYGEYQVYCKDGSEEIVTSLDIKLDNVCPKLTSISDYEILSVHKNTDGTFDVVCKNLSKHTASKEELMEGTVCEKTPNPIPSPQYSLKEETYYPVSSESYFCDSYYIADTVYDTSSNLKSFTLGCTNSDSWGFTCNSGHCNATGGRTIDLTSGVNDEFEYQTGGYTSRMTL